MRTHFLLEETARGLSHKIALCLSFCLILPSDITQPYCRKFATNDRLAEIYVKGNNRGRGHCK